MRAKVCSECGRKSAFAICAECSGRYVGSTPRLSVGHQGQYGYRLTKGFVLMHFEDDEYVSIRDRGVLLAHLGDGWVIEGAETPWPSRWWRDRHSDEDGEC
jgi:hypothetical protein